MSEFTTHWTASDADTQPAANSAVRAICYCGWAGHFASHEAADAALEKHDCTAGDDAAVLQRLEEQCHMGRRW